MTRGAHSFIHGRAVRHSIGWRLRLRCWCLASVKPDGQGRKTEPDAERQREGTNAHACFYFSPNA
jgi:hypothetical protein